MIELTVQNLHASKPITEQQWEQYFATWITQPGLDLPVAPNDTCYEISLRLTDDREVQQLNGQYRQQDRATDVLAFASIDDTIPYPDGEPVYLGDIIISVDMAQRQAIEQNHSLSVELLWLASHGFLHLLGWDHPDDLTLAEMLACQGRLLGTIGVATATI